ncbi:MAG: 6,7-dimethyl-8-ribityllumazine synthase [Xanthobacteraceae bacterium]|nr:MAG: 6,7-dimethyl-8-ribityllumazine synthase [Xanthobacteraceae bacterium]
MAQPSRQQTNSKGDLAGSRVLVVEARFYDGIVDALREGAVTALKEAGAEHDIVTVPGALEVPSAIAIAIEAAERRGKPYDAAVALGCVIRGETFHFEIVSMESARALMDLAVRSQVPLGNGILTVENEQQAWARARRAEGDKGGDAARAALAVLRLKRDLSKA